MADGSFTETEARKIPCPFFRYVWNEHDVVQDGRPAIYVHQNCMASGCIAWREVPREHHNDPVYGYCGIAGEPS